jgi:hypothetical protein
MLKKALFVAALVAVPTAAFAQDDTTGGGDGGGSAAAAGGTAATTAGDQMAPSGSGPAIFKAGTMGISIPLVFFNLDLGGLAGTTAPVVNTVNITKFQDANNALDIILGVRLAVTPDTVDMAGNPVAGATTFGFAAGLGYRMYKHHTGKISTFLEPQAIVSVGDVSSFADVLTIGIGARMGVECMFTDWFSVMGSIGAQVDFSDKFKDIELTTPTSGLTANFYWD